VIEVSWEGLREAKELLGRIPGAVERAEIRAVNRAAKAAKTSLVREILSRYNIKRDRVEETISIFGAGAGHPFASVASRGRPRVLSYFRTRPNVESGPPFRRPGAGVWAQVKKGEGGNIPHAFLARMRSGHVGVFLRPGSGDYPIDQRSGPSVPQMAGNRDVVVTVEERAMGILDRTFLHEVRRALGRRGG
jgi:hypothetical protein